MEARLEFQHGGRAEVIPLAPPRPSVGSAPANDLVIDDPTVSRLHAAFDHLGAGWTVRDLSSSNGTFVNGERIWSERPLRSGDELRFGGAWAVFRGEEGPGQEERRTEPAPALTPGQRDVIVELCRPLLAGRAFTEPASVREIAAALVLSEDAVRQQLARLARSFAVDAAAPHHRADLANDALRRGVITVADLREPPSR